MGASQQMMMAQAAAGGGGGWTLTQVGTTDDFNRASLGSDYSDRGNSTMAIEASTVFRASHFGVIGSTYGAAAYVGANAGSITADQYFTISLASLTDQGAGHGVGGILRASTDVNPNDDFYYAYVDSDAGNGGTHTVVVGRMVNGTPTSIGTRSSVFSNADTFTAAIKGSTIRVFRNGTQLGADLTDSNLTSGAVGILCMSNSGAGNYGDNLIIGNVT